LAGCGPSAATMPRARSVAGKEKNTSMTRMRTWSTRPPVSRRRRRGPRRSRGDRGEGDLESAARRGSAGEEIRPKASAPSGRAQLDPPSGPAAPCGAGSQGKAVRGGRDDHERPYDQEPASGAVPTSATATRRGRPHRATPGAPALRRPSRRQPSRIRGRASHRACRRGCWWRRRDRHDQHGSPDEGVVALADRRQQHPAESGTEKISSTTTALLRRYPTCTPRIVTTTMRPLRSAWPTTAGAPSPSRARSDVVCAEDVEHGRSRGPHDDGGRGHAERHGGEEEEPAVGPGVLEEADVLPGVRYPPR
jgi:hypothetical protein